MPGFATFRINIEVNEADSEVRYSAVNCLIIAIDLLAQSKEDDDGILPVMIRQFL